MRGIEVIILVILGLKGPARTIELTRFARASCQQVRNALVTLRRKGLVKSIPCSILRFLNNSDLPPSREKVHTLAKPLDEIWKQAEFQRALEEYFGTSDFNEIKQLFLKALNSHGGLNGHLFNLFYF